MEATILDPLAFELDLPKLLIALRIRPGSSRVTEVERLAEEARLIARPRVIYKLAFVETKEDEAVVIGGIRFASRVLRVNLEGLNRVFAYVCTSGQELESWAEGQADILMRFWADAINQAVLGAATTHFRAHLLERFAIEQVSTMNPGSLADWPLREQRPLFALLGDVQAAIGVELTPSLLMTPTKSVSGILFPTVETFASCQLCPREECPNRRAVYDPLLFAQRYQMAR